MKVITFFFSLVWGEKPGVGSGVPNKGHSMNKEGGVCVEDMAAVFLVLFDLTERRLGASEREN